MNARILLRTAAVALGALLLTACKGPEGVYKLDKTETKKMVEAEIEKMPEEQKGMAKMMIGMFDSMDMSIELKAGGDAEMKATMPSLGGGEAPKTDTKTGKWSKDGGKIVIDGDGKKVSCALEGAKLSCETGEKAGQKLVFNKS
jgi:hypothetical protein